MKESVDENRKLFFLLCQVLVMEYLKGEVVRGFYAGVSQAKLFVIVLFK